MLIKGMLEVAKSDTDNRSNQMNPNNDAYYQSRGYESREESYDSGEYIGPYISGPQPRQSIPTFEQKEKRFLHQGRQKIAASMTTSKAAEIIWHLLLHDFPELEVDVDHYAGSVYVSITGCLPASEVAQSIEATIKNWLKDRHWLIGGCVEGVQVTFAYSGERDRSFRGS